MDGKNTSTANPISIIKLTIFSVTPVLLLLITSEMALRVWMHHFRTSYERYNYVTARLELVPNTHSTIANGREILINSKGFVGPEFEDRKPTGVYRIFALGDSCTFGGTWKQAYPEVLNQLFNAAGLSQRVELINAGIEGYNSEYALSRLKEDLLQYDPDMIIIYIGWNDLMKINPDNLSDTGKYTWLARLMDQSYLMKGYNKFIFFYLRPLLVKPKLVGDEAEAQVFDHFVPLTFQENLEAMLKTLEEKQIRPLLLTLPTVVRHGMSYDELQRQGVFFPYYAGTYSVDKFLSLHRSYNNVIRKVASENNVPLVDLDAIFNTHEKSDLFWDTMHPSIEGHRLIAQSILDNIKELMYP